LKGISNSTDTIIDLTLTGQYSEYVEETVKEITHWKQLFFANLEMKEAERTGNTELLDRDVHLQRESYRTVDGDLDLIPCIENIWQPRRDLKSIDQLAS
jgi:hypothetical protein